MASTFEPSTITYEDTRPTLFENNNDDDLNISIGAITSLLDGGPGQGQHYSGFCSPYGFQFTVNTIIMGLLCILGLCGNTISILVLQKDRNNRVAVFLLQSLALADSSILCICLITLSTIYGLEQVFADNDLFKYFKYIALRYTTPIGNIALCIGIWLTVLLAINRYIAVCRPFTAKRWLTMTSARIQVAIVVILSVVFNIPRVFRYGDYCQGNNTSANCSGSELTALARKRWFGLYYLNAFYLSVISVLPLILLVGFNVPLIRQMQKTKRRMKRNSLSYSGRQENNITIVMIAIILELIVFHTPDRIVQAIRAYHTVYEIGQTPLCPDPVYIANILSNLLIILNSSTNFIVYYICRRRFRQTLCRKICCGAGSNPTDQSPLPSEANGGSVHNIHSLGRSRHKSPVDVDGGTMSLKDRYRLTKKRDSNQCLLKVNGTHM